MAGYEQKQFVTNTINQYDVLTGRGSGPYEQPGNVHFRDLVSTRKIEYLSLNARDSRMKNQIAKDIIEAVRAKGGRFLRKIQLDSDRDGALYEFVDEPTVLEKAKQALRQNRSGFIKTVAYKSAGGKAAAPPTYDALQAKAKALATLRAEAASMTASSAPPPTKPTPREPLHSRQQMPPSPQMMALPYGSSTRSERISDLSPPTQSSSYVDHGGGAFNDGCDSLDFSGITGPPPDPSTPEEWEAFHAYWSDGNEPNRTVWDRLQAQQQQQPHHLLQQHQQGNHHQQYQEQHCQQGQQQYQLQHQQQDQIYKIPENAASSSHYYSTEQELWDQINRQQQQQQYMPTTPITSNMNNNIMAGSSNTIPSSQHGFVAAAPGMGEPPPITSPSQNSIQNQQDILNYLSHQQNNCFDNVVSNQYQGYRPQQQTASMAAAASAVDDRVSTRTPENTALMTAYLAQVEQQLILESKILRGQGNNDISSSSYMPSIQDDDSTRARTLIQELEQTEYLPVSKAAAGPAIMSVATKGHDRNDIFGQNSAGVSKRLSDGSGREDDHDSFFSGIKDMSLPSISIGEVSDFGKISRSSVSREQAHKEVIEDAADRALDVQDRFQEVVAKLPSQRQQVEVAGSVAPSINPSPIKKRAKVAKRRSLSSYYHQVNAAVAASNGRRSVGDLASEANEVMDNMSCSLQSMSLAETNNSDHSPQLCQGG